MAQQAKKSEHSGSKKGRGAYWGRKKDAKSESKRLRRKTDKNAEKPVSERMKYENLKTIYIGS